MHLPVLACWSLPILHKKACKLNLTQTTNDSKIEIITPWLELTKCALCGTVCFHAIFVTCNIRLSKKILTLNLKCHLKTSHWQHRPYNTGRCLAYTDLTKYSNTVSHFVHCMSQQTCEQLNSALRRPTAQTHTGDTDHLRHETANGDAAVFCRKLECPAGHPGSGNNTSHVTHISDVKRGSKNRNSLQFRVLEIEFLNS